MIKFVSQKDRSFERIIRLLSRWIHAQSDFFDEQKNMKKGILFALLFADNVISDRVELEIVLEKVYSEEFYVYFQMSEIPSRYEEFLSGHSWGQVKGLWINIGFNCEQELFDWLCGDIVILPNGKAQVPEASCCICGEKNKSKLIYATGYYGSKLDTFMGLPCYCQSCFEASVRQDFADYDRGYEVYDLEGKCLPVLGAMYSTLQRLRLVGEGP